MHAADYLLRVSEDALDGIALSHLFTADDPAVLADFCGTPRLGTRAGSTEWAGQIGGQMVSLAWDWVQLADGTIQAMAATAPRTNLRLMDSKGYDCTPAQEESALWRWIAQLGWREEVRAQLHGSCGIGVPPTGNQTH